MAAQGEAGRKRTHSIDDEELPTDVVARGTCQEDDGASKVPRLAPPPCWDAFRDLAQAHRVLQQLLVPVCESRKQRQRGPRQHSASGGCDFRNRRRSC